MTNALFPMFMEPLGVGGGTVFVPGGGDIILSMEAEPDITVEQEDVVLQLPAEEVSVEVEPEIIIEVED